MVIQRNRYGAAPGNLHGRKPGSIKRWHWDFGDGTTSKEQSPVHRYKEAGKYIVVLNVEGPDGKFRMAKVWDVAVK